MSYRELLEQYRNGQLDDSRKNQVEADLEKHEALTDYLCDKSEIPSLEDVSADDSPDNGGCDSLTDAVQKSVHRAFVRLGVIVGISVLAVTLCALTVLPRIVNLFYYNPLEIAGREDGTNTNRMSLDLSVWTELFLPGRFRNYAAPVPRGYGAYDFVILQNSSADGRFTTVGGQLVRNHMLLYDVNLFRAPASNAFLLPADKKSHSMLVSYAANSEMGEQTSVAREDERRAAFDSLRSRPTNDLLIGYISFEKIAAYPDFVRWYRALEVKHTDAWAGIYTEDEYGFWAAENTGVLLNPSGVVMQWDKEKYPHLSLLGDERFHQNGIEDEALMTDHFTDLLKYMDDHPELMDIFPNYTELDVQSALHYAEENGLNVYGMAMVASRDELLKLEADPAVSSISYTPY